MELETNGKGKSKKGFEKNSEKCLTADDTYDKVIFA